MKIFSDSQFEAPAADLLRQGIAPHELLVPAQPVSSVLAEGEPDPAFGQADVAFGQPDLESIERSERLRWVHISSAGFTRYDTPEFRALAAARGLLVTNSSSVYAEACAEHLLAFMLANARALPAALRTRTASGTPEWLHLRAGGVSLRRQRVVILGYGSIAACLVKMLAPFEMEIVAMRRTPRGDEGVQTVAPAHIDAALATADHVVNILPDNAASRGFVNAARFAAMRPGAIFYNIGRGTTVDQEALAAALRHGHLAAAWLDVTDPEPLPETHPLLRLENCHITPHTAGGHRAEGETLVRHFLVNLRRFEAGEPVLDKVL